MPTSIKTADTQHLRNRSTLRTITALVGTYLALSVVTLVAMVVLRNDPTIVTTAVWIRGSLVTASAVLLFIFARRRRRSPSLPSRSHSVRDRACRDRSYCRAPWDFPDLVSDRAGRLRNSDARRCHLGQHQAPAHPLFPSLTEGLG
jgi:hypothetical protein